MAHTTLVLETNCHFSQWHIKIATQHCQKMLGKQTNIWTLCNAKVINDKHDNPAPTYKSMKKVSVSPTMWSMSFDLAIMTSSIVCVATRTSTC